MHRSMTAWLAEIANEFIRRASAEKRALTQAELQRLVYIAHGCNLAINGESLTHDGPQAWGYGPVYRYLWEALGTYGRTLVTRGVRNDEILVRRPRRGATGCAGARRATTNARSSTASIMPMAASTLSNCRR
jgi:uncharacterized phage-associated protein